MTKKVISISLLSGSLGLVVFLFLLKLNLTQNYSDFVVGDISWYAVGKTRDLLVFPVVILVIFLSYLLLSKVFFIIENKYGNDKTEILFSYLIFWLIPLYVSIAGSLLGGSIDKRILLISFLAILFIISVFLLNKNESNQLEVETVNYALLSVFFLALIPFEIGILISRFAPFLLDDNRISSVFKMLSCSVFGIGYIVLLFLFKNNLYKVIYFLPKLISFSQAGLPIFYLALYPVKLQDSSIGIVEYGVTNYFYALLGALIAFSLYSIVNRYILFRKINHLNHLFSPVALFAIFVIIFLGNTKVPMISPDDYHFGEYLIGFWSYTKGLLPYVDYIPAHGVIENDITMAIVNLFYDGTAGGFVQATNLTYFFASSIAFISIYRFTGKLFYSFIIVSLLIHFRAGFYYLIPFICLWLSKRLREKPACWLVVWLFSAPLLIIALPPQGIILVASFSVLAIKMLWDLFHSKEKNAYYTILGALIIFCLLMYTPFSSILFGAIRYVLENGAINQIAYGIPWNYSWNFRRTDLGILFEVIRMLWVIAAIFFLFTAWKTKNTFKESTGIFYPSLVFFIFSILLIPYAMGRIDSFGLSRPGTSTVLCSSMLLLLVFIKNWHPLNKSICILFIMTFISLKGESLEIKNFAETATQNKLLVNNLVSGEKVGLSNLGVVNIDSTHLDRIKRLNELLNEKLKDDESYLDLTSRNAQYFYTDRVPLLPVTAMYNLASPLQQKRVIESLKSLPKVALLQANNIIHDGGGLALRNHYIYQFIIDNYFPVLEYGKSVENYIPNTERQFIFGYRKNNLISAKSIIAEVINYNDENWQSGFGRKHTAILLSDPILTTMLHIGDEVKFANDIIRKITKIDVKNNSIWLDGEPITPLLGKQNLVEIETTEQVQKEYYASLFQRAFFVSHLRKIPVAWGRSENTLNKKMELVAKLNFEQSIGVQVIRNAQGGYSIQGNDPQLFFDLSAFNLSGRNAGLLKLKFECIGQRDTPRLQVFWWGDYREQPFESSSLKADVDNGTLIIPLDVSPWWSLLDKAKGLRIDLDNPNACESIRIKELGIYQRK